MGLSGETGGSDLLKSDSVKSRLRLKSKVCPLQEKVGLTARQLGTSLPFLAERESVD